VAKLRLKLHELDPKAFVNILDSSEIMGKKYKSIPTE